ncbi:MAG: glycosyltransferase family 4 protein [Minisyncoccia bacterium]
MKIVFLSDDFPPQSFGGGGISTFDLALGVKNAGHEVYVVTTCRKVEESGESEYNGLKIFRIASNYSPKWRAYLSIYNPKVIRKLEKILEELRPDIVHVNNVHFYLSYYSIKLSKRYAQKVVFTARDAMSFSFGKLETEKYLKTFDARLTALDQLRQARKRWNPFRNILIRHFLGYADKILAVSLALQQALEQNGINNVKVAHTGLNVSDWQASNEEVSLFKSNSLTGNKLVFFAGRISKAKGSEVANQVMTKVQKEIPEARLLIAGGSGHWVNRDEMRIAYATSDIVLVPSVCFDALPRVVLEASASGKPVISTPYGGAKEIIENGVTGYIIDPFNTDEMARKIVDLFKDSEKAKSFGKAGHERIKSHFNLEKKVEEILDCYKYLINGRNGDSISRLAVSNR